MNEKPTYEINMPKILFGLAGWLIVAAAFWLFWLVFGNGYVPQAPYGQ